MADTFTTTSFGNQALIPRSFSTNDTYGLADHNSNDNSSIYPHTPPITPPKGLRFHISPYSPYGYSNNGNSNPPSPTNIHIHSPPPWYTSRSFAAVIFGILGFMAFGIHQCGPIIASTAGALANVGNVVGSVANVGDALSGSVKQTTRITGGVADGVGEVWCALFGGKRCGIAYYNPPSSEMGYGNAGIAPDETANPIGSSALLEGAKLVGTLKDLGLIKPNLTASADVLYLSEYLTQAPLIQYIASQWSDRLRFASPSYFKTLQARNSAYSRTLTVLQGLVDQYNTAVLVSKSSSSMLDLTSSSHRRDLLHSELARMASYTFANHHAASTTLRDVYVTSEELYLEGKSVLGQVRRSLVMLEKEKATVRAGIMCGWVKKLCGAKLRELEWTLALLEGVVQTLEVHTNDAALMTQVSQQLMGDLDMFIAAFNATAGVINDNRSGDMSVGKPTNPWLTLQRLEPGLSELSVRLKELPNNN